MSVIVFSRGDGAHHTFAIPATSWAAGGTLLFAAKPAIDDDNTDANALINFSWNDSNLMSDVVVNGVTYKKYKCDFPGSATNSIPSGGAASADYLGEFKYVPLTGDPITAPATDQKLDCIVYFNVKKKNSL